jgi:hypothetical protein
MILSSNISQTISFRQLRLFYSNSSPSKLLVWKIRTWSERSILLQNPQFDLSREKPQRGDQRIFWLRSRKILKGGPKETFLRNISKFSPKISLGPPFKVFLDSSQNILWSPLWGFLLNFLKNRGGGQVLPWSPLWDFFQRKFSRGGLHPTCTPPLRNTAYDMNCI